MKKLYLALGAIALISTLALAACAGEATPTPTPAPLATATPTPLPTPTPTPDVGPSSAPVPQGFANAGLLVDTAWLARNLNDPTLRIIDVRAADRYTQGHIEGAVSLLSNQFTVTVNTIPNMAPLPADFALLMEQAGVANDTKVVIVDDGNLLWASRLLWTLDYYGHTNHVVVHGGMAAWQADGRPVTRKAPEVAKAAFATKPNPALLADLAYVQSKLKVQGVVPVDNRSVAEYTGKDVRSKRGGHVPGAVNIDWNTHLNAGDVPTLKTPAQLKALYEAAGVTKDKEAITYCQTAIRAAHGYLVLRLLGYDKVRVYDGSWVEWGNRDDTPVETA